MSILKEDKMQQNRQTIKTTITNRQYKFTDVATLSPKDCKFNLKEHQTIDSCKSGRVNYLEPKRNFKSARTQIYRRKRQLSKDKFINNSKTINIGERPISAGVLSTTKNEGVDDYVRNIIVGNIHASEKEQMQNEVIKNFNKIWVDKRDYAVSKKIFHSNLSIRKKIKEPSKSSNQVNFFGDLTFYNRSTQIDHVPQNQFFSRRKVLKNKQSRIDKIIQKSKQNDLFITANQMLKKYIGNNRQNRRQKISQSSSSFSYRNSQRKNSQDNNLISIPQILNVKKVTIH